MSGTSKFEVGQKLWYVPTRRYSQPSWVTIEKVGRKWLSVDGRLRLDVETLRADAGQYSSPGRAYLSEEAHQAEVGLRRKWDAFRTGVGRLYRPPQHLSEADIDRLLAALSPGEGEK